MRRGRKGKFCSFFEKSSAFLWQKNGRIRRKPAGKKRDFREGQPGFPFKDWHRRGSEPGFGRRFGTSFSRGS